MLAFVSYGPRAEGFSMTSSAKGGDATTPGARALPADEAIQGPGLDRVIQAQIGDKLRAMYGELVDQPVPDKLASLLDELSRQAPRR